MPLFDARRVGKIMTAIVDANTYGTVKTLRFSLDWMEELAEACGGGEGDDADRTVMLLLAGVRDYKAEKEQEKLEKAILAGEEKT